jgi:hypothetical protein
MRKRSIVLIVQMKKLDKLEIIKPEKELPEIKPEVRPEQTGCFYYLEDRIGADPVSISVWLLRLQRVRVHLNPNVVEFLI